MTARIDVSSLASATTAATTTAVDSSLDPEGIIAGILGAATVAVWFLVMDLFNGHALYTPTALGLALFGRGHGVLGPASLPMEMVLMFTWVHGLAFMVIGGIVSRLLGLTERNPSLGFGVLLFFVIFGFGFTVMAMLFATFVLHVLTWAAVLTANLLAAAAMVGYFRRRHPTLRVSP